MQVALFVPCYIDQLYPNVGMATVDLLERFGCDVVVPTEQTCCGQPMANTGLTEQTRPLAEKFLDLFAEYEYVVCPSGSCTAMVEDIRADRISRRHSEGQQDRRQLSPQSRFASELPRPERASSG